MTHSQFGMLAGFAVGWCWVATGFLAAIAAVLTAAIGLGVARVLEGRVDLNAVAEHLAAPRR